LLNKCHVSHSEVRLAVYGGSVMYSEMLPVEDNTLLQNCARVHLETVITNLTDEVPTCSLCLPALVMHITLEDGCWSSTGRQ